MVVHCLVVSVIRSSISSVCGLGCFLCMMPELPPNLHLASSDVKPYSSITELHRNRNSLTVCVLCPLSDSSATACWLVLIAHIPMMSVAIVYCDLVTEDVHCYNGWPIKLCVQRLWYKHCWMMSRCDKLDWTIYTSATQTVAHPLHVGEYLDSWLLLQQHVLRHTEETCI